MIQTTTSEALAVASAGSTTTTYPDTDNQMEDGVFSFAKRDDEVTTAVDAAGVAMLHVGRRHFRH